MKFDAYAYTIQVRKVTEDGETFFKATAAELPHLATYESTHQEAYEVLIEDIGVLHATAERMGHVFPQPMLEPAQEHSGRITLRIPRSLHRKLDEKSTAEGVSLNSCVMTLLAEGVAVAHVAAVASESILAVTKTAVATVAQSKSNNLVAARKNQQPETQYHSRIQIQSMKETEKWTARTT